MEGIEFGEVAGKVVGGEGVVLEVTGEEFVVGGHIYQPVARQVEENHFLFAGLFAAVGLTDGGGDGVARLRSRNDAFGTGEEDSGIETFKLIDVNRLHKAIFKQL